MSKPSIQEELATGRILPLLLKLALPITLAQLVNALYNIVDRMYIGQMPGIGTNALTGLGFTMPIIMAVSAFSLLIGMGGAPLMSIKIGEGDEEGAARLQGNSLSLLLGIGILLTVVLYPLRDPVLRLFGASDATIGYASDYIGIYLLGTVFVMISMGMNSFLNAQGHTMIGTITVVIGAVLNIVLDPIFIYVFDMGIAGAALATILSQFVSAAWVLLFLLFSPRMIVRIRLKDLLVTLKTTLHICSLGVSSFIFMVNESVVQIIINLLLRKYGGSPAAGDLYIGSMTIISSLLQIFYMPLQGIVRGAQPIIGYCFGARNHARLRETLHYERICSITCATLMWLAFMLFPGAIARVFTPDAALIALTIPMTRLSFCTLFVIGLQMVNQNAFIAMGNARLSFFFGILRKIIILLPLAFLLPMAMGIEGVFFAEPLSNVLTVIVTQLVFTHYMKKLELSFSVQ